MDIEREVVDLHVTNCLHQRVGRKQVMTARLNIHKCLPGGSVQICHLKRMSETCYLKKKLRLKILYPSTYIAYSLAFLERLIIKKRVSSPLSIGNDQNLIVFS